MDRPPTRARRSPLAPDVPLPAGDGPTASIWTPSTDSLAAAASPCRVGWPRASSTIPSLNRFIVVSRQSSRRAAKERRVRATGQYCLVIFGVDATTFPSPSTFKKKLFAILAETASEPTKTFTR
jgi:hypothetical protein